MEDSKEVAKEANDAGSPLDLASLLVCLGASVALVLTPEMGIVWLVVWRVLQGCGACAAFSVGAGTISDVYRIEQRGRAFGINSLGPLLGALIGPPIGGSTFAVRRLPLRFRRHRGRHGTPHRGHLCLPPRNAAYSGTRQQACQDQLLIYVPSTKTSMGLDSDLGAIDHLVGSERSKPHPRLRRYQTGQAV